RRTRSPLTAHAFSHQMVALSESGLTIASPDLHPNASANSLRFDSGPITRHNAGACGLTVTWLRRYWSVSLARQIWAHARKKRCSEVRPSMAGGRGLPARERWNAAYATFNPPRSAMFSPRVSRPFTWVALST